MGIRQCGKTFIAQQFASENYKHVVYINFFKEEERKTAFYGSKDVDNIIMLLSAQMRNAKFVPGESLLISDSKVKTMLFRIRKELRDYLIKEGYSL